MLTVRDFLMPDLGEGLAEGEITAGWSRVTSSPSTSRRRDHDREGRGRGADPVRRARVRVARRGGHQVPVGAPLISVATAAPGGTRPGPQTAGAPDDGLTAGR